MKVSFVSGGAGFIGSNLCLRLLNLGHSVICYDNLSTGQLRFLENMTSHPNFKFIKGDVLDFDLLKASMNGVDTVWHLSANADIRFGLEHPRKDLEQNTIATYNILEAMRGCGVSEILFSSTGSVYGDTLVIPTPENAPFPIQTSLYAASKVACEGIIAAYCEGYGFRANVFRFVSILGEGYSHGHVFDFVKQLKEHPSELFVLGNGHQKKSYLYVQDCINALLMAYSNKTSRFEVYNLGTDSYCTVRDSIKWICQRLAVQPELSFSGGERGWVGDIPFIWLDTQKIRALGWTPQLTIQESVEKTVDFLMKTPWILEVRN